MPMRISTGDVKSIRDAEEREVEQMERRRLARIQLHALGAPQHLAQCRWQGDAAEARGGWQQQRQPRHAQPL